MFRLPWKPSKERATLNAGIVLLRPLLATHGFKVERGTTAVSSGGPFASSHFRRGDLRIGIIVRDGTRLGCPDYSLGNRQAAHDRLLAHLGVTAGGQLVPGAHLEYVARDGGDAFHALLADLRDSILPAYTGSEQDFRRALLRAWADARTALGLPADA